MPKAIPVLESNIEFILKFAKDRGFNLDYLPDNKEYNAEEFDDVTYLITDGSVETRNLTFTDVTGAGFDQSWTFAEPEDPSNFAEIKRI